MEHFMSDSEDEEMPQIEQQQQRRLLQGIPLQHFLRILAGGRMVDHGTANSNGDLIQNFINEGVIETNSRVKYALEKCPRDNFIPEAYKEQAFQDTPIRVDEHDFNISAPHMHAICLQALDIRPGHSVLDVGSGCGFITAASAVLTGKQGHVLGIDKKKECISMGRDNVKRLINDETSSYKDVAAECIFEHMDVYFLSGAHRYGHRSYDRIHVGAACLPEKLNPILKLLNDDGGIIVVPVSPSDLRVITKNADGTVDQKVITQVRFSELEVPSDIDVALARLKAERKSRLMVEAMPSTYSGDVDAMKMHMGRGAGGKRTDNVMMSSSPHGVIDGLPPSPHAQYIRNHMNNNSSNNNNRFEEVAAILKDSDCTLKGNGWNIPTHSIVLRQRSDYFQGRFNSGMRDASFASIDVPHHFTKDAMGRFLQYIYYDHISDMDPESAIDVLHIAQYYGVQRLSQICEVSLAKVIKKGQRSQKQVENIAEAAVSLLSLAHDQHLMYLRAVALDFVTKNLNEVSKTGAYAALPRECVDIVVQSACERLQRTEAVIKEVKDVFGVVLPDP